MSGASLRVLLAGFSGLGADQDHQQDMYLPAFRAHPGFDVVAVTDVGDRPIAETLAAKLSASPASSSGAAVRHLPEWRDAVADPDVDVVSVCAPLADRIDVVTAALRAGKHVLVDKPMAASAAESAVLAGVAAETGRVLLPAHHHRFHPLIAAARGAVASGKVGLPWNVQADFLVAGGASVDAGELANFAVYPVDVVLAVTGQPVRRVHARTITWTDAPGEDLAVLFLDHDHGLTSTITVGRISGLADTPPAGLAVHRYRISGSHGVLDVDATRPAVSVRNADHTARAWHGGSTVDRLLDELRAAVLAGRPANPSPADAVHVAEVVDAARRAVESGHPVDIRTTDRPEASR